jgi:hypothetical protein
LNQPPNRERLVVNKALRRRSGMFGVNSGLAISALSILVLGVIFAQFLPLGIVVGMTLALFMATIYVFRNGTDPILGRFRKPRHYTRGGLDYIRVLKHVQAKVQNTEK